MKKKCAVPVPSGFANPSAVLPALYLWAKGHTVGKKSNQPGKLTTALGKQVSLMKLAYNMQHPTTCRFTPGQRRTPNPQRGRPRFQSQVIMRTKQRWISVNANFNPSITTPYINIAFSPVQSGAVSIETYFWTNPIASAVYEFFALFGPPDAFPLPNLAQWNLTSERATLTGDWFNRVGKHTVCMAPASFKAHTTMAFANFGYTF